MSQVATCAPEVVRFSVFELDRRTGELRKNGRKVKLEGKPLLLLDLLIRAPSDVVTREEVRRGLWPDDTCVDFEHGINATVKRLRQALGDSAETPRFVETLPRRGYRFIYPLSNPVRDAAPDPAARSRTLSWLARGAILLLALAGLAAVLVKPRTASTSAAPADAYQLYLQGHQAAGLRSRESLLRAVDIFQHAVAQDPDSALANAGLADAYAILGNNNFLPGYIAYPRARAAARRALERNDKLAEAHLALALVLFSDDWDWPGAELEYHRAIQLNPAYSDAHQYYSRFLSSMGRHEEAVAEVKEALRLDPLSFRAHENAGLAYFFARRYDDAIHALQRAIELDPARPRGLYERLGWVYMSSGKHTEAIATLTKATEISGGDPISIGSLAHAYAVAGRRADALRMLRQLEAMSHRVFVTPVWFAYVYTGLNERTAALEWLEKAYREHDSRLWWIKADPRFDPLRSEPRFHALLQRMRLAS